MIRQKDPLQTVLLLPYHHDARTANISLLDKRSIDPCSHSRSTACMSPTLAAESRSMAPIPTLCVPDIHSFWLSFRTELGKPECPFADGYLPKSYRCTCAADSHLAIKKLPSLAARGISENQFRPEKMLKSATTISVLLAVLLWTPERLAWARDPSRHPERPKSAPQLPRAPPSDTFHFDRTGVAGRSQPSCNVPQHTPLPGLDATSQRRQRLRTHSVPLSDPDPPQTRKRDQYLGELAKRRAPVLQRRAKRVETDPHVVISQGLRDSAQRAAHEARLAMAAAQRHDEHFQQHGHGSLRESLRAGTLRGDFVEQHNYLAELQRQGLRPLQERTALHLQTLRDAIQRMHGIHMTVQDQRWAQNFERDVLGPLQRQHDQMFRHVFVEHQRLWPLSGPR